MPVQTDGLTSTKGRPLPVGVDGDGLAVSSPLQFDLLQAILTELQQIRLILSIAFEVDTVPEDGE